MKKFFVMFLLVISIANFSFGAYVSVGKSNAQTSKTSHQIERMNHLVNPDLIYPNQGLFLPIPGFSYPIYYDVVNGDNLWFISKRVNNGEFNHADEMVPSKANLIGSIKDDSKPLSLVITDFVKDNWLGILLLLLVLAILILALTDENFRNFMNRPLFPKKEKGRFSNDPTKEGKPFVEGGVSEEKSSEHFSTLAVRSNPGINPSNIVIKDKKRVYISTPNKESATVEFADGTKGIYSFRNAYGWSAMVSTDGGKKFKREIYFQDCGNPVYSRTSMKEAGLIITDEPVNFGSKMGASSSESERSAPETKEEAKQEVKKPFETPAAHELDKVSGDHAMVANEFLQTQKAHKATMKCTKNADGSFTFESIFETKNEVNDKSETKQQKTEEKKG